MNVCIVDVLVAGGGQHSWPPEDVSCIKHSETLRYDEHSAAWTSETKQQMWSDFFTSQHLRLRTPRVELQ